MVGSGPKRIVVTNRADGLNQARIFLNDGMFKI